MVLKLCDYCIVEDKTLYRIRHIRKLDPGATNHRAEEGGQGAYREDG